MRTKTVRLVLAICLGVTGSGWCVESIALDSAADSLGATPICRVSIERMRIDDGQIFDTVDVMFETDGIDLAGFAFKIGLASQLLTIMEILPGEMIDSCQWEMFHPGALAPHPAEPRLSELWQITALARMGVGDSLPVCYRFTRPVSLARLVVSSAHVPVAPDTALPIFFYWEYCRDNALSDREGASIIISDTVLNAIPPPFKTASDQFPTVFGTPSACIDRRASSVPRRLVEFQNGGVEFELNTEPVADDSTQSSD